MSHLSEIRAKVEAALKNLDSLRFELIDIRNEIMAAEGGYKSDKKSEVIVVPEVPTVKEILEPVAKETVKEVKAPVKEVKAPVKEDNDWVTIREWVTSSSKLLTPMFEYEKSGPKLASFLANISAVVTRVRKYMRFKKVKNSYYYDRNDMDKYVADYLKANPLLLNKYRRKEVEYKIPEHNVERIAKTEGVRPSEILEEAQYRDDRFWQFDALVAGAAMRSSSDKKSLAFVCKVDDGAWYYSEELGEKCLKNLDMFYDKCKTAAWWIKHNNK